MYVLRRVRYPLKAWARPRRVSAPANRGSRLRGADRRLADALNQQREGIPLNWSQVEDDPELEMLAALQETAQVCRDVEYDLPEGLAPALIQELSSRLPEWKPEPVKAAPTSLAGFSENVQVLTQVEEDVPSLISRAPQWIAATLAASLLAVWALSAVSSFLFPPDVTSYRWIQVRENGKAVTRQTGLPGYTLPLCRGYTLGSPGAKRAFLEVPSDRRQLLSSVAFPVSFLPSSFLGSGKATRTITYNFRLDSAAVSPCAEETISPNDEGALLKMMYQMQYGPGRGFGQQTVLKVFQGSRQPAILDASPGSWKQLRVGDAYGVYWHGAPYRDIEGEDWLGDASVMIIERNDIVTTFVGDARHGATEDMMADLLQEIGSTGNAQGREASQPVPSSTQTGQPLSRRSGRDSRAIPMPGGTTDVR